MNYIKRSDDTRTCHDKFIIIDNIKILSEYIVENQMTRESLTYDYSDFHKTFKGFFGFDKSNRSSFAYWFAHWCAFQLTALNIGRWKFKYLLHDFEKPWMKLFCKYKTVQKWHREHNSHHLEYGLKHGWDKVDWEALIIDWECSRLTKTEAQLDAYETMNYELNNKWKYYRNDIAPRFYIKLYEMHL